MVAESPVPPRSSVASLSGRVPVLSSTPPSLLPPQSTRRNPFGFEQACLDEPVMARLCRLHRFGSLTGLILHPKAWTLNGPIVHFQIIKILLFSILDVSVKLIAFVSVSSVYPEVGVEATIF